MPKAIPSAAKPKGPAGMIDVIASRLEEQTGRNIENWVSAVRGLGLPARKEMVEWLMREHGLGRVAANLVASRAEGKAIAYDDQDELLQAMYAGPKQALLPIYERLVEIGQSLGPEFSLYQCAGQTTFKRTRQFAWIKPSTKTRMDLGLALPGFEPAGRLLPVPGTNDKDRVRLRIALSSSADVDAEVRKWLKRAWDLEAQPKSH